MVDDIACPICSRPTALYDVVDFNKSCEEARGKFVALAGEPVYYRRCDGCGFLFAPDFMTWPDARFAEKIYNDDYLYFDPDHGGDRAANSAKIVGDLFGHAKGSIRHIDHGGGDGALSRILTADGWTSATFDRFYDDKPPPEGTFDLITSFEVFEHVPDVHAMMKDLVALSHEHSFILFSTFVSDNHVRPNERIGWWYVSPRNGHISIYSSRSLALLAGAYGFKYGAFNENIHCLFKTAPDWAAHLITGG